MRMTPMEMDIQLQASELLFRSCLEGKRLGISKHQDLDDWYREVLGEEWMEENAKQRAEVLRQMKQEGENTPMWMEAVAHMSDIAWEVFETGECGERVRKLVDINREEILAQLRELEPMLRISHFARCGAGDKLFGLRACVAIFRQFVRDTEVLQHTATCLKSMIEGNDYNRNGLCCVAVPMPPAERLDSTNEQGWCFLRAALDAYMVQAGCLPHGCPEVQDWSQLYFGEEADKQAPHRNHLGDYGKLNKGKGLNMDRGQYKAMVDENLAKDGQEVALLLVACIVAAKGAPALIAQLKMLKEETPEHACDERKQLKSMIPAALAKTEELANVHVADEAKRKVLMELKVMLEVAC